MNFYKRHLGDYAKDAGHLSMLEHGAYTLLLDRYYTTEKTIPSLMDAYRVCRARSRDERDAVDTVLREFFVTDGEAFINRRAEEEIAKASHQRSVNQELGKRGGRPKRTESETESVTEPKTESVPISNPSQTPDSISQRKKPPIPPPGVGRFPEFWEVWPKSPRKGGKPECLRLWQSKGLEREADAVLAHVKAMAATEGWTKAGGDYVPAPAVYLRGRRWDGAELVNGSEHADQPWAGAL